ncbi:hypothetical protein [Saccharibacillus endophyticus]|uniref:SbsC C-terminal domain-containing protein n=1 Tax=Saccharibacillus endophyticus TaxID=2060666 RepID=A0ABQ1ZZ55_9BACL|nr:hypothetical protein [Saccharibacillus endophyticus]GGH82312.1 hypothetical protein GCM10007362_33440 [Saccharibacillus endophyticus]
MNEPKKRTRKKIPALAAMALMTALTGSILPAERVEAAAAPSGFNAVSAKSDVSGMWTYIEKNAASSSPASVTVWLRRLETVQNKRLPGLEEALSREPIQDALMNTDGIYGDWKKGTRTGNAQADKLLAEIENNGYVLDSTEGYFFPKIDYLRYMKQASRTTGRYADYLKIRSDETVSELTKDAGLMVSWKELVERAERQSRYLVSYPNTPETETVQQMYDQSLYIVLYGTDNVPLFDYDTRKIDPEAKAAYRKQIRTKSQSPFTKMLRNYTRVLEQNGGTLTKSVEAFRDVRNPWVEE